MMCTVKRLLAFAALLLLQRTVQTDEADENYEDSLLLFPLHLLLCESPPLPTFPCQLTILNTMCHLSPPSLCASHCLFANEGPKPPDS